MSYPSRLLLALILWPIPSGVAANFVDDIEVVSGPLREQFDGRSDDLLTAGLGIEGLRTPSTAWDKPLESTWRERRRRAIAANWRSLIDLRTASGLGQTYGPLGDQRVAGVEYLTLLRQPDGSGVFTVWLQIPHHFDPAAACLAAVASSGSRGIFGALPTAATRALQRGCAVVHNDKGLGTGIALPDLMLGLSFDGRVIHLNDTLANTSLWPPDPQTGPAPRANEPHHVGFKHAHSGDFEEARWGDMLILSARHALALLNAELRQRGQSQHLTPDNTLLLALGISNGGAAVLQALERDGGQFFDAAVVSEPNAQTANSPSLYEYAAEHALYQPCAILAESLTDIPFGLVVASQPAPFQEWCKRLVSAGKLQGQDTATQALAARRRLLDLGVRPEALRLGMTNLQFGLWPSVLATYASAYAQTGLGSMPCGANFAALDALGQPRALQAEELARAYVDSSGIAPTAGIQLLARDDQGTRSILAASSFDFIACLADQAPSLALSLSRIRLQANPGKRPLLLVHGRDDALIPVSLTSQRYLKAAAAQLDTDQLRYYEVPGAQHFDAFLALPGMQSYRPLQPHFETAIDAVIAHLRDATPLPPSQVVRAEILPNPPADSQIALHDGKLVIPE